MNNLLQQPQSCQTDVSGSLIMMPIPTPKGLKGYNPWGKTLSDLQITHKDIKVLKTGTRATDKVKFKVGQWARLKDGKEIKIIGFDIYNYPLQINKDDKPLAEYNNGSMRTTVYKVKYKRIVRAIHAICLGYCFTDLQEWEWLPKNCH